MMDARGPGQPSRLWLTNAKVDARLRVCLDGEGEPCVDLSVMRLFAGSVPPFVWPLVGNDSIFSGGYYCYVPIAFRPGCKVTTDCKDLYCNETCTHSPSTAFCAVLQLSAAQQAAVRDTADTTGGQNRERESLEPGRGLDVR